EFRRHLRAEQAGVRPFDDGMVGRMGSDDPARDPEAEQGGLVADDVRHDPLPRLLRREDDVARAERTDQVQGVPGLPGHAGPPVAGEAVRPERRLSSTPSIRLNPGAELLPPDFGLNRADVVRALRDHRELGPEQAREVGPRQEYDAIRLLAHHPMAEAVLGPAQPAPEPGNR